MSEPDENDRHPIAKASDWVSRIMTVVIMMIAPGLIGHWLDDRWGTGFLTLIGFAVGLPASIWYLLQMTKEVNKQDKNENDKK